MDYRRYGAGFAFLIRLLEKGWAVESAKRGARFLLSLYKNRDCFFIYSSFLAGKEAKEAGGTYEWFPLDPLSTFDGDAVPLDSPCSMGRVSTSGRVLQKKYRAGDVPPPRYGRCW